MMITTYNFVRSLSYITNDNSWNYVVETSSFENYSAYIFFP